MRDSGVDTDQFNIQVNQRTAATVNGRIRLMKFHSFPHSGRYVPAPRRYRGHGTAQTKRVTDGDV